MEYLLAIYGDEKAVEAIPEDQMEDFWAGWFKYDQEVRASVNVVHGSALQPTGTATTVRYKDGAVVTSDGPFAETKEQVGGYYLIDVEDLDTALEWAGKMPSLPDGSTVEVRPLQVFEQ